ncbi:30S ribosomal protein S2 [Oscillatoria laete-virens NRMC-F 0139]|nr:30S ribosomal protein S2 [Oscillatoria laete-virens]MDL5052319.1 30S ribosomal protein S2 [Oscillatoria laete-virens NRMC-F 0139]
MSKIDIKQLIEAGVHFGHQTRRWNPKMKDFIFEARNGIHIINLTHTVEQIAAAQDFLRTVAQSGGDILFVGTKKQAKEVVKQAAERSGSPFVVERWLGGMLTNLKTIRRSINRLNELDGMDKDGRTQLLTKKEQSMHRHESEKLHRNLDGIRNMEGQPGALVVVDVNYEQIALAEAKRLNIPVVAIVDTNVNPTLVDYPIAGNDDAIRSIKIIIDALAATVEEGRKNAPRKRSKTPASAKSGAEAETTGVEAEIEAVSA